MAREVPGIQPTVGGLGQYSVGQRRAAAVPVPRSKALDLADTLNAFMGVAKSYGGLQKQQEQIGLEQAQLVEEQNIVAELKKQKDVDGFSILATTNRDRAYRDALLKRHINSTLLPSLEAKTQDLVNAETYKTQADFSQAVDKTLSTEWESLVGQVGEGVANSTAGKALWSMVTSPYKNELSLKYEKARDEVILNNSTQELGLQLSVATKPIVDTATGRVIPLDTSNLQTIAENTEARLSEDLPQLSNTDRNKVLVSAYATEVDNLYAQQRYTDASRMLAVLKATKINGVPVFNTTQAKSVLNPIEAKLNNKLLSLDEKRDTKVGKRFANKVVDVLANIKNIEEREQLSDITAEIMKDTFISLNPNLTIDQLDAEINNLFNGTAAPFQLYNQRLKELVVIGGDEADALYFDNIGTIKEAYQDAVQFPFDPIPLTKDNRDKLVEDFIQYNKETNKDATEFLKEKHSNSIKISSIPELKAKSEELMAGEYVKDRSVYKDVRNRLTSLLKVIDQQYEEDGFELDYGNFKETASDAIEKQLVTKAKELSGPEFNETRDTKLQSFAEGLLQDGRARYEGIVKAKSVALDIAPLTGAEVKRIEGIEPSKEDAIRNKGDILYKSLGETKTRRVSRRGERTVYTSGKIDRALINEDRQLMMKNRDRKDLKLSLFRHGFDGYSADSAKILNESGMDYMDVKLFGNDQEFRNLIGRWSPVLQKDITNQPLTAEEKAIRDEFQAFGVYDNKTMLKFDASQSGFLND